MNRPILLAIALTTCLVSGCGPVGKYTGPDKRIVMTSENYEALVGDGAKMLVIEFHQKDCAPCEKVDNHVARLSNELSSIATFARVDVDTQAPIADRYSINEMPTFLFLKDGKELGREVGIIDLTELRTTVKRYAP